MPVDLALLCDDLESETDVLDRLLSPLDEPDWDRPTPAPGWSVRDQVSHLAHFDEEAVAALLDPRRFCAARDAARAAGDDVTAVAAARHRGLSGDDVRTWFRRARARMLGVFRDADAGARVPWYGPDMSLASAVTARIMETWAHGQDVADALGARRTPTGALRHVAHLGVRTLPNSFTTRARPVPDRPVRVELTAPDGALWTWGDPGAADAVRGPALDFCLVVTQRRHVDDTELVATGAVAREWLGIAQAFAGPPGAGRQPLRPGRDSTP